MAYQGRTERRSFKRYVFREEILLEGTYAGTSTNISERGIFVFSLEPYDEDAVIDIVIPLQKEKLTVRARVRHCQPGIGMGLLFVDLNDEQRAKIKELVAAAAQQSS